VQDRISVPLPHITYSITIECAANSKLGCCCCYCKCHCNCLQAGTIGTYLSPEHAAVGTSPFAAITCALLSYHFWDISKQPGARGDLHIHGLLQCVKCALTTVSRLTLCVERHNMIISVSGHRLLEEVSNIWMYGCIVLSQHNYVRTGTAQHSVSAAITRSRVQLVC
jgi:hypothetical protein